MSLAAISQWLKTRQLIGVSIHPDDWRCLRFDQPSFEALLLGVPVEIDDTLEPGQIKYTTRPAPDIESMMAFLDDALAGQPLGKED